ncbi:MAG: gliding motility-associated C-terminal domain-containing protein [Chitinophagaceae bacterium]|nr:gliding motility-associated C-terminal domain-containing protein [Chitinophagaceae bacterium]
MKTKILILFLAFLCAHSIVKAQCPTSDTIFPTDSIIICADTGFVLSVPYSPGTTYDWSTLESGNSITIHQGGKYWLTVSNGACPPVTDTVFIIFNSLILIPEVENGLLCLNVPASALRANGTDLKWYNTPTDIAFSTTAPTPPTADTGIAYYYVSQTILGCESPRAKVKVEVIEAPNFELGGDISIPCGASGVVLQTVKQKYTTYAWQDGSTNIDFLATEAGTYTLTGSNKCGTHTDDVRTVICNTRCLNFPNAFTPNGDGKNELFKPGSFCPMSKYVLTVYDRFGKTVFHSTNPTEGWDGRVNGKKADIGTYIYYCIYNDFMLKMDLMLRGTVTLIK